MNYCEKCGHKNENPDQQFCVNCGQPFESNDTSSKGDMDDRLLSTKQVKQEKTPMTKKHKRIIIFSSAITIVLVVFFLIGNYITSHERLADNFVEALEEKDPDKVAKLLSFSKGKEEIDSADTKGFLKYLEENPEIAEDIGQSVLEQSKILDSKNEIRSMEEYTDRVFYGNGNDMVLLAKGERFLFFDTYELIVEPVYVNLSTNVEDAALFAGDEEVANSDSSDYSKKVGPFLPGTYTFSAEVDTDMVALTTESQATVLNQVEDVGLYFDVSYISFEVPFESELKSRVLLDDKEIDFNIYGGEEFGPVLLDGSMNIAVEVDFPWGTMRTADQPLESNYVPVVFEINEDLQEQMKLTLQSYTDLYMESLIDNDIAALNGFSENLQYQYESDFSIHNYLDTYTYYRQIAGMHVDKENVDVYLDDDTFYLNLLIEEEYKYGSYYKDEGMDEGSESDTSIYNYELIYKDNSWNVYDKYSQYYSELTSPVDLEVSTDLITIGEGSQEVSTSASADELNESEMEDYMDSYFQTMVSSINERDFSISEAVLDPAGSYYSEHKDYLVYLEEKGITEELLDVELVEFEQVDEGYNVTTKEEYNIYYDDGTGKNKLFESEFLVTPVDDGIKVNTLVSTTELESKDL
ncbi:zinc ribbon domain-containing protein [Oceanobacillus sp. 1P07AA]|uniref:zinc ribbon domain-containing protein n=1 Tax=Oceanobacillus sp. 1P07AA TaxID=3132293 RepID=UPI0039A4E7EE